jgi:hypothetical protein
VSRSVPLARVITPAIATRPCAGNGELARSLDRTVGLQRQHTRRLRQQRVGGFRGRRRGEVDESSGALLRDVTQGGRVAARGSGYRVQRHFRRREAASPKFDNPSENNEDFLRSRVRDECAKVRRAIVDRR